MANVGIGKLSNHCQQTQDSASQFYFEMGQYAKEKGVTVNIVSIIGGECNLQVLSKVSELSGGNVERYNSEDLQNNIVNIVSKPLIASNV